MPSATCNERRRRAGVVAFALLVGCSRAPAPNVLLVVVDTLRADRLGCYGDPRGLTPVLDSLAARGTLFRNAYAQASWTTPSVASLLTSRYQAQHGMVTVHSVLADQEVTLAEILRERGWRTGGFMANTMLGRAWGFAQGYDAYQTFMSFKTLPVRADALDRAALAWLDGLPAGEARPTLLHLHYMEPHIPYEPTPDALARVRPGRPALDIAAVNKAWWLGHVAPLPAETLADVRDAYDAEVNSLDTGIGMLVAELERRGFLANALVVITADHGEEFMDHGSMGHGRTLYNEIIHVPLILLGRGVPAGVVDTPVSLIDVAPTLLALAGLPPAPTFEGTARTAELRGRDATPTDPAYAELLLPAEENANRTRPHERAVVVGTRKLILGIGGEREYYALDTDPREQNPAALAPDERARLGAALDAIRAATTRSVSVPGHHALDEETRQRLQALGYAH